MISPAPLIWEYDARDDNEGTGVTRLLPERIFRALFAPSGARMFAPYHRIPPECLQVSPDRKLSQTRSWDIFQHSRGMRQKGISPLSLLRANKAPKNSSDEHLKTARRARISGRGVFQSRIAKGVTPFARRRHTCSLNLFSYTNRATCPIRSPGSKATGGISMRVWQPGARRVVARAATTNT